MTRKHTRIHAYTHTRTHALGNFAYTYCVYARCTDIFVIRCIPLNVLLDYIYLQIVRARFGSSPTLVFYRNWRLPFDRMYLVTEDGQEHPTPQALKELGSIVMFQSSSWYMAIVDM